ncbi:DUF4129 domain-containing protein [Nocardia sp. XZ_19_385]|uniref:DUF4129 domain-containing protein n=1 Tax=Nocardia sp. XZ_19_385 TaxID=2769488 RepID=UPI00188E8DF8|nr:DUF4129 domain-containing protein [Nocardia sp. XZ_19_385]
MSDPVEIEFWRPPAEDPAPEIPPLGSAAQHRGAADAAAANRDYDRALRERFRAMVRGLEQGGVLEVRRSRTADETAQDVSGALPLEVTTEIQPAARSFDEVVYGGRSATEDEYRRLELADRYSQAAPGPKKGPVETDPVEVGARKRRELPAVPRLLRNPKFWAGVLASIALALVLWGALNALGTPPAPKPPQQPDIPPPKRPEDDDTCWIFCSGQDSIFTRLPAWLAFGGLQFLIAGAALAWWRARRRGALVREPRPVEVAANELLAGQSALYRRSGDHDYVAAKLRAATLRRVRPLLGVPADAKPEQVIAAVSARTGTDERMVGTALYGPVPDTDTLRIVAAVLDLIEADTPSSTPAGAAAGPRGGDR